jgi:hypothetical protein
MGRAWPATDRQATPFRCAAGGEAVTLMIGSYVLLHGLAGDWDEVALVVLAPVVVAAVLWVTRRHDDEDDGE